MNFNPADIRVMVRAATQRTGAPLHDEDLEQEATLRAVEAFRRKCEVRYPRAFLMKIVQDTVSDHWRRRRSLEDIESIDEARFAQRSTVEDDIDRNRQRDALRRAMIMLDPAKRATLDLYYSEGCSIADIARRRRKSRSAVKMELFRARRTLCRLIFTLLNKKSR